MLPYPTLRVFLIPLLGQGENEQGRCLFALWDSVLQAAGPVKFVRKVEFLFARLSPFKYSLTFALTCDTMVAEISSSGFTSSLAGFPERIKQDALAGVTGYSRFKESLS
jgi:hypothetical protein